MAKKTGIVYVGIGSHVVALDAGSGVEIWKRKLKGSTFVTLQVDGDALLAGVNGEVFCLDAKTGEVRWHNKLKGLGMGFVTFGTTNEISAAAAAVAAQQAAASAAVIAST
ncbi:MAG: PQQ-binding-like beta-propeller repeat protein [Thermoanaerobaculia bacterium]